LGGKNLVFGEAGNDIAILGEGKTTIDGGDGSDTVDGRLARHGADIDLASGEVFGKGLGPTILISIEDVTGSDGNDYLSGDEGANLLDGGLRRDLLEGREGEDHLVGGASGDTLTGGMGSDLLDGGSGADTFTFLSVGDSGPDAPDLIVKLQAGDLIDLSAIDADESHAGNQAFHLTDTFTHHEGELMLNYDAGADITTVGGDVNGDGSADLVINIIGAHTDFTQFVL
jgi:Ca2+-binding RTX toxin-like protein